MMYRKANLQEDWSSVVTALTKLMSFAATYDWVGSIDWVKGTDAIAETIRSGHGYIVDGYLVLTDKVIPWYTKDVILQEWLVIKVYPGGNITSVPLALEAIAEEQGCKFIMSADSSPVNIVGRAYEEAGYLPLTHSFYKATTWASSDK